MTRNKIPKLALLVSIASRSFPSLSPNLLFFLGFFKPNNALLLRHYAPPLQWLSFRATILIAVFHSVYTTVENLDFSRGTRKVPVHLPSTSIFTGQYDCTNYTFRPLNSTRAPIDFKRQLFHRIKDDDIYETGIVRIFSI